MDSTLDTATIAVAEDRDRWMAWGGPAFLVVFVAIGILSGSSIAEDSSGKEVIAAFAKHRDSNYVAVFLSAPGLAFLLLFVARLRSQLGPLAGAARHLLQYGAVIYAAALSAGAVLALGLIGATDHHQEGVAQTLNVLNADSWIPMTIGVALFLLGAGIAVLRSGLLPRWMGWVAAVAGVISLLGPGGFLGFFLAPVWIGVAGVMLATRRAVPVVAAPAM